jgi:hypothetical protein
MDSLLENHLNCCRCCSNLLKTTQKTVKISKSIEKRFYELSGIKVSFKNLINNHFNDLNFIGIN